jgi:ribose transport system permease protein
MGARRHHGGGHDLRDPAGGFDLSIASGYSLCAVVAAYVGQTHAPLIAFAAAIAAGLAFGLANGLLVAVVRINPFITTVGTGFIITGISLVMTQNAAFAVNMTTSAFSEPGGGTACPIQECC